jgi:hypothetical protein
MSSRFGGRSRTAVRSATLVLIVVGAAGCVSYKQDQNATSTVWKVRATTDPRDVAGCRRIETVDSRDAEKGCGLTVQPTPEECLRYQVRLAGGDTLLRNGPIGVAYACGSTEAEAPGTFAATAPPAPTPTPAPPEAALPRATPVPVLAVPAPTPTVAAPPPPPAVRISSEREAAKGCVYLGDVSGAGSCADDHGRASGDCVGQALGSGGDLIVVDGGRAQIFSCKARP